MAKLSAKSAAKKLAKELQEAAVPKASKPVKKKAYRYVKKPSMKVAKRSPEQAKMLNGILKLVVRRVCGPQARTIVFKKSLALPQKEAVIKFHKDEAEPLGFKRLTWGKDMRSCTFHVHSVK